MTQQVRSRYGVCEGVGLIPGLTQWVKGPVLSQAMVEVADGAQMGRGCGCGGGLSCSSDLIPSLEPSICHQCSLKKEGEI